MRRMGLDEAGRGCVLGALFVGAFVTEADDTTLAAAGATDSKALTAARRASALERLRGHGTWSLTEIPATAIDAGNLNKLEEDAIVALIAEARPDEVMIDALGHPRALPGILERLRVALADRGLHPELRMEPKADLNWPVVGAASIHAKLRRDAALEAWAAEAGDLGSGYPSDPTTRAWLAAWGASGRPWPAFVRTRWGTLEKIAQQALFG